MAIGHETKTKSKFAHEPQERQGSCGSFVCGADLRFRPITIADLDEIMAIERASYPFPWSSNFFRQELQVACARSVLVELHGTILGYVLFWLLPGAVDIHNVAVHLDYRRRGIASMLLERVISEARDHGAVRVLLEVRKSNLPAQSLYQRIGFIVTGVRKGYYSDNGEDALAMTLDLAIVGS